jgi:hypothetical protein
MHRKNISRKTKKRLALGILAAFLVALPAIAYAQKTYFNETISTTIHDAPIMTLESVVSNGIDSGISGCTGLPAGSDGSSVVSLTCSLDATRGDSGSIVVTLHANYPIASVTVAASGSSADFVISNPAPQTVGTTSVAFVIGLSIPTSAPDSSTPLVISIQA